MRSLSKSDNVIQEPELRLLVAEIPSLVIHFQEIQLPPVTAPEAVRQKIKNNPAKNPGILPENIPLPKDLEGKLEVFFCLVERPRHWKRYLVTQKNQLRVMSPYGCVRLCKDIGLKKITLNLNNPSQWPEDWF